MATLLDVGLLNFFNPLFAFLLIFVLAYAILLKTQIFGGESKGIYMIIATVAGLLTLAVPDAVAFISLAIPYFMIFALVIFLVIFLFLALGVQGGDITEHIKTDKIVMWTILVGSILLVIFLLSQTFGAELAPGEEGAEGGDGLNQTVVEILFHPTMLGALFLLILTAFAVRLLTLS